MSSCSLGDFSKSANKCASKVVSFWSYVLRPTSYVIFCNCDSYVVLAGCLQFISSKYSFPVFCSSTTSIPNSPFHPDSRKRLPTSIAIFLYCVNCFLVKILRGSSQSLPIVLNGLSVKGKRPVIW